MKRVIKAMVFALVLLNASMIVSASDKYSEGYFYYIVEDNSITITGYFGKESAVRVPSQIAGYPVSKIGSSAFADAKTVQTLYLPDTIMEIEEGSIGGSIGVVHAKNNESSQIGENNEQQVTEENQEVAQTPEESGNTEGFGISEDTEDIQEGAFDEASASNNVFQYSEVAGIKIKGGAKITVDQEGNLIKVLKDGSIEILDDSQTYKLEENGEKVKIYDGNGNPIKVDKDGNISTQSGMNKWILVGVAAFVLLLVGIYTILRKKRDVSCEKE